MDLCPFTKTLKMFCNSGWGKTCIYLIVLCILLFCEKILSLVNSKSIVSKKYKIKSLESFAWTPVNKGFILITFLKNIGLPAYLSFEESWLTTSK